MLANQIGYGLTSEITLPTNEMRAILKHIWKSLTDICATTFSLTLWITIQTHFLIWRIFLAKIPSALAQIILFLLAKYTVLEYIRIWFLASELKDQRIYQSPWKKEYSTRTLLNFWSFDHTEHHYTIPWNNIFELLFTHI